MRVLLLSLILWVSGCATYTHDHFDHTSYVRKFQTQVINDSLQLFLKTGWDHEFTTEKKAVRQAVQDQPDCLRDLLNERGGILLHSRTRIAPVFGVFLLVRDTAGNEPQEEYPLHSCSGVYQLDTLIGGKRFHLIGRPKDPENLKLLRGELGKILGSIERGKGYREEVGSPLALAHHFQGSHNYLKAYEEIASYPAKTQREKGLKHQMQMTFGSFFEEHPDLPDLLHRYHEAAGALDDSLFTRTKEKFIRGGTAFDHVIDEATDHRVVMINESHFKPRHRALTAALLDDLWEAGFRYLALEALANGQDSLLNQSDTSLTVESGFYTSEPHFGRMIRKARKKGFTLVGYEHMNHPDGRETGQATKLYEKTLGRDSAARVLVHAGPSHIKEKGGEDQKKWMAEVFREKYGIDPLTIDQVEMDPQRPVDLNSILLLPAEETPPDLEVRVDLFVVNGLSSGDPGADGHEVTYRNKMDAPVQVNLFHKDELGPKGHYSSLIPYRCLYARSGEKVRLSLSGKEFQLVVWDASGKVIKEKALWKE